MYFLGNGGYTNQEREIGVGERRKERECVLVRKKMEKRKMWKLEVKRKRMK